MRLRVFIDRLGDLDEEITKVCRASEILIKGAGKSGSSVDRLKDACEALQEKQEMVREAKNALLGFEGFLHALGDDLRKLTEDPKKGAFLGRVQEHMGPPLDAHVAVVAEGALDGLRQVEEATKALRQAKEDQKQADGLKESVKSISKVCNAAENALRKVMDHTSPKKEEKSEEKTKEAGEIGFHGYSLTAKELPPEFLENIKKKKEEAKDKKEEDLEKKAESRVPGNESKGPKDEGEEDEGWVPGHRTSQKPSESKKANTDHGYCLN